MTQHLVSRGRVNHYILWSGDSCPSRAPDRETRRETPFRWNRARCDGADEHAEQDSSRPPGPSQRGGPQRPWPSPRSEPRSASAATSPPRACTPTTRCAGSGATPGSPTSATARWPSSSSGVEVPESWSVNATNILAQKYFRGTLGTAEREWSLRQVADRVVDTITAWGIKDGYFVDDEEAEVFHHELKHLIIHQKAAFNSPVWFNIGVPGRAAAGLGVLHPLGRGHDGLDPQLVHRGGRSSSRVARAPASTCRASAPRTSC